MPTPRLRRTATAIDAVNNRIGRSVSWLALAMVLVQFVIVVQRYVFGVGSIWMQESIIYMHATMFLLAAGYTLLHNGHVRVDIFYREAPPRRKAVTDLFGVAVFLLPMCGATIWLAWPYVASSWAVLEGSTAPSGIDAIFLLKSTIIVFAVLVALQGISLAIRAASVLAGAPPPDAYAPDERPPDII